MKMRLLLLGAAALLLSACNDYGKKIPYGKSEVYHKGKGVTESDAKAVGDYLEEAGYFKTVNKTVQLTHDGEDYMVHLVVDESKLSDQVRRNFWKLQHDISKNALGGKPTRLVLADEYLKDLEVMDPIARYKYGESELFYNSGQFRKSDVEALVEFMSGANVFTKENGAVIFYEKQGKTPVVRMAVNPDKFDDEMLPGFSFLQEQMQDKVFDGKKAKLVLTSLTLEDLDPLPKLTNAQRQAFLNAMNGNTEQASQQVVDSTVTESTTSGVLRLPNE